MTYVQAMEQIYVNGSVEFSTFAMPRHPIFDWYCSHRAFHDMEFFKNFWSAPTVKQTFPFELEANIDLSSACDAGSHVKANPQNTFRLASPFSELTIQP